MFGKIILSLYSLDHSALDEAYGVKSEEMFFRDSVVTMLLCRLGENCDSSGILSEQLCWQSAICKPNVNAYEAILANMRERGINTDALNDYVNATYARFVARDVSLFVRKK